MAELSASVLCGSIYCSVNCELAKANPKKFTVGIIDFLQKMDGRVSI